MTKREIETIWEGRYLRLVVERGWQYVERCGITGIVAIIPVTEEGELVLIEQARVPIGGRVIEVPAGLVGDAPGMEQESFETAARRELLEETGFEAATMEWLFEGPVSAGLADERLTYFLARGCRRVGDGGGDGSEDITTHVVPLEGALGWLEAQISAGKSVDVKVMAILRFWLNPPAKGGDR
jgi:ADP-ribose pyrophosphatase